MDREECGEGTKKVGGCMCGGGGKGQRRWVGGWVAWQQEQQVWAGFGRTAFCQGSSTRSVLPAQIIAALARAPLT
jgi:hypothetical protein